MATTAAAAAAQAAAPVAATAASSTSNSATASAWPRPSYEVNPWASLEPWGAEYSGDAADTRANQFISVLNGRGPLTAAGHIHSGYARAPEAEVVPTEAGWARSSAMSDLFADGPKVLREAYDEAVAMFRR